MAKLAKEHRKWKDAMVLEPVACEQIQAAITIHAQSNQSSTVQTDTNQRSVNHLSANQQSANQQIANQAIGAVSDPLLKSVFAERYKLFYRLGQGSMATVYEGYDINEGQRVAIKLLHSHLATLPQAVARFEQECRSTRSITHPNVVTVFESGMKNGRPFLVMEFIDGKSLADVIRKKGSVDPAFLLEVFIQVCAALSAAHQKGVIHRDLKPANILLSIKAPGEIQVKIVDFGIAHVIPNLGETHFRCTQSGEMLGSLLYMSPEQCLEQDIDNRSDIYSLGCIFYEALTGCTPMAGRTAFETINNHLAETPISISRVCPNIKLPSGMEAVIFKALEKNPEDRFQTVEELQRELELMRGGELPVTALDKRFEKIESRSRSKERSHREETSSKSKSDIDKKLFFLSVWAVFSTLVTISILVLHFSVQNPALAQAQGSDVVQSPSTGTYFVDPSSYTMPSCVEPICAEPIVENTVEASDGEQGGCDGMDGMDGDTVLAPLNINPNKEEEKALLSPSSHDFSQYAAFLKSPNTGLIRLLPREKYEGVLRIKGGGAYYSFARRVQAHGHGSDIELQNNRFKVGLAGSDFGHFIKLGDVPLERVDMNTPELKTLANQMPDSSSCNYRISAETNCTYLLRSINKGDSDVLVAFRPVRKDKDGSFIILWKKIKQSKPTE